MRRVLDYYEEQTEDEAVAEDEAAFENDSHTIVEVPKELLPTVRELLHATKHRVVVFSVAGGGPSAR